MGRRRKRRIQAKTVAMVWIVIRVEDAKGFHLSRVRPDGTGLRVIANAGIPQRSSAWGTGR
jgi:hypothetical protein